MKELERRTELELVGQLANEAARANVFRDFQERKSSNTLRAYEAALHLFAKFLKETGVEVGDLMNEPKAWRGVTWGLVEGFLRWQLLKGYAIASINTRLSVVRKHAALAATAGIIEPTEVAMIKMVKGYRHGEGKEINGKREAASISTRKGPKKAEHITITPEQAEQLRRQPNTPQGRRDAVLISLMIELGLRIGEVALLSASDFNLDAGELTFYRPKVDKIQTHTLPPATLEAVTRYMHDAFRDGPLLRGSKKGGKLTKSGMSNEAISDRVRTLGERVGIHRLSAHDLRHHWATKAARNGTPIDRLMDAGGWTSPAMPLRYIEETRIANERVDLERVKDRKS